MSIDKYFRDRLQGAEELPSPQVWDRLSQSLTRKPKVINISWWLKVAAILLLAALPTTWGLLHDFTDLDDALVSSADPLSQYEGENVDGLGEVPVVEPILAPIDTANLDLLMRERQPEVRGEQLAVVPIEIVKRTNSVVKEKDISARSGSDNRGVVEHVKPLPASKNYCLAGLGEVQASVYTLHDSRNARALSFEDRAIITANIAARKVLEDKESDKWVWAAGLRSSSVSNVQGVGSGSTIDKNLSLASLYNDNGTIQEKYDQVGKFKQDVSTGIIVEVSTHKRVSFVSGISYARFSQSQKQLEGSVYASQGVISASQGMESGKKTNLWGHVNLPTVSNTVEVYNMTGDVIYGSVGHVPIMSNSKQTYLAVDLEASYLEIPLIMSYKVLDMDNRFSINMQGGFYSGILIDNDLSINGSSRGDTKGLESLTWSATGGLGFAYLLGKHVSFSFEPEYRIFLEPMSSSGDQRLKPYVFSMNARLMYRF